MLTKPFPVCSAFPTCLKLGAIFLLSVWPLANGQCPEVFGYQRDHSTTHLYGIVELHDLRIGQLVKLNVVLSIGVAIPENNIGSIALVESKEQTIRGIYNNQPALYRVNFPITNVIPKVLTITVNGQTICTGEKAKGKFITTISHQHTLLVKLEPLSNSKGNNVRPQQVQTPRPQLQSTVLLNASAWSDDECGKPAVVYNRLSTNGQYSRRGEFPWAVPVFIVQSASKMPKYICGSTIISRYHLVTTGHCLTEDNNERQAADLLTAPGMYNIDDFLKPDIQMAYVKSIIVHPDYYTDDYGKTDFDIAVLVLQKPIVFNDLVRPICLWDGNDNLEDIVGRTGLVSGWGITESGATKRPSYVMAKVLPKNQCQRNLGHIFDPSKTMLCADVSYGVPSSVDSGSGLVFNQGSQFFIRGVFSICQLDPYTLICDTTKYVIYTDIAPFRFWLHNVMKFKVNK